MKITIQTRNKANGLVDRATRYRQIKDVLSDKTMTAKEIAVEMNLKGYIPTSERNFTAPRLNELVKLGVVIISGKKKCQYTDRTVALYKRVGVA